MVYHRMSKKFDIKIGDKINFLTIIGTTKNKHNQTQMVAKCDCGNVIKAMPSSLMKKRGATVSCGCFKIKRIKEANTKIKVGMRLGKLTIIEDLEKHNKHGQRLLKVECDCGTIKIIPSNVYKVKSCGCVKRIAEDPEKSDMKQYAHVARKRSIIFTLSKKQYTELIYSNCFYCGMSPNMKMKVGKKLKNGIDRVDCKGGYCIDNCVSACSKCNWAKRILTIDDFFQMIKTIYEYHSLQKITLSNSFSTSKMPY